MADPGDALHRHAVPVLHFSGGKDSTAVLLLLQQHWDRLIVAWVNTGDAFPETLELMDRVRRLVPNFLEVQSDQPAQHAAHGWPTELLPITNTPLGRALDGHDRPLLQSYADCCGANIWEPMARAMRAIGATLIIRGTRLANGRKSPIRSGDVVDGVAYWHPIERWSDEEVFAFLRRRGWLPEHYAHTETSLDCRRCTAEVVGRGIRILQIHRLAGSDAAHMARLLDLADLPYGASLFDAGCGVGAPAEHIAALRPDLRLTLPCLGRTEEAALFLAHAIGGERDNRIAELAQSIDFLPRTRRLCHLHSVGE